MADVSTGSFLLGQTEEVSATIGSTVGQESVVEFLVMVWVSGGTLEAIWTF